MEKIDHPLKEIGKEETQKYSNDTDKLCISIKKSFKFIRLKQYVKDCERVVLDND